MAKHSSQYPELFENVPDAAHLMKEFIVDCETEQEARSMKTYWYGYVKALRQEGSERAIGSATVVCRVKGKQVIFADRNQDTVATRLRAGYERLPLEVKKQVLRDEYDPEMAAIKGRTPRTD